MVSYQTLTFFREFHCLLRSGRIIVVFSESISNSFILKLPKMRDISFSMRSLRLFLSSIHSFERLHLCKSHEACSCSITPFVLWFKQFPYSIEDAENKEQSFCMKVRFNHPINHLSSYGAKHIQIINGKSDDKSEEPLQAKHLYTTSAYNVLKEVSFFKKI